MVDIVASRQYKRDAVSTNTYECSYHGRILRLRDPQPVGRGQGLDGVKRMLKEGPGEQSGLVMMDGEKLNITKEDCTCGR
jgi:hypothetical protein